MSNALTGDFDVVVEASVPAVDRVLATLHQAETFLHSFTLRIDDVPPIIFAPPSSEAVLPAAQRRARRPTEVEAPARTTSAEHASSVERRFSGGILQDDEFTGVRGFAEIQVSTPTITLPQSADTSEVTVHYTVIVHFIADPATPAMPEFLHGELQATVDVDRVASQVGNVLEIDFTREDIAVNFIPFFAEPPLSPGQNDQINQVIHNTLRTTFQPVNAMLPGGIQQVDFKSLPNAAQPTAALLLNLRTDAPPNPNPDSVTRGFLNVDDQFAVAAGRDYVLSVLNQASGNVNRDFDISFKINLIFFTVTINYHIHLDSISADLQFGQIVLTINGSATTSSILPNLHFRVTQAVTLNVQQGVVSLAAVGGPNLSISDGLGGAILNLFSGLIAGQLSNTLNTLLQQAQPAVQQALDSRNTLGAVLNSLNISATLTYTSVEIQPDGLILHGTLDVPDFVAFAPAEFSSNLVSVNGEILLELNALNTWIPGGTIQEYDWIGPVSVTDQDRFIIRVPSNNSPSQWCLIVQGTRITASGTPTQETVLGFNLSCLILIPFVGLLQGDNALIRRLTFFVPGREAAVRSSDALAYVAPWGTGSALAHSRTNLIVHFADSHIAAELTEIRDAMFASSKNNSAILVVAVLPPEYRWVKPIDFGANGSLAFAEDDQDAWQRVFSVKEIPATYLVNPQGEVVWQHIGRLQAAGLAEAFNKHLISGGRLLWQQLRLAVQPGEPAPDFLFEYTPGRELALRRLRGRPVLLHFWTSWSKPHLKELHHLQKLYNKSTERRLTILAINDGENPKQAQEVFSRNGFTFHLITDTNRQISQLYGVNCWPTTVLLDENGFVKSIQLGLTPGE